jgi:hypothetical protein
MKTLPKANNVLIISDTQAPFHHPDTLPFLAALSKCLKPKYVVHVGDECFTEATDVLTTKGWKSIKDVSTEDLVLQVNQDGTSEFVCPSRKIDKDYTGPLVQRTCRKYSSLTTPGHNLVQVDANGQWSKRRADDDTNRHHTVPRSTTHNGPGLPLSDDQLRLAVALSADFTLRKQGDWYGDLDKPRKIHRMLGLIERLDLRCVVNTTTDRPGRVSFFLDNTNNLDFCHKQFPTKWLGLMSFWQKQVFLDELKHWDGYDDPTRDRVAYCSPDKHNLEFVQTLCHMTGLESSIRAVRSKYGVSGQASILLNPRKTRFNHNIEKPNFRGKVYCVTVPSGMLLVRHEGQIHVSGNCDNHTLARNYKPHPNAPSAGDEFKQAKKFLDGLEELFPVLYLAESNHTARLWKTTQDAGIPDQWIRTPNEAFDKPRWEWYREIWLQTKLGPVCVQHGDRQKGALRYARTLGASTIQGHHHSEFGIQFQNSRHRILYGMDVGCLCDADALALAYARTNPLGQMLGTGVVVDGYPRLVPMGLTVKGRWDKKIRL